MSDLIKREEAIKVVHEYFIEALSKEPTKIDEDGDSVDKLLTHNKKISKALKALPSADAVQGWIPCSEGLPGIKEHHVSDPCLVYCENGAYGFAELEENIFGQVGWDCEREDEYHEPLGEVIAWMPLPTPYREENEE